MHKRTGILLVLTLGGFYETLGSTLLYRSNEHLKVAYPCFGGNCIAWNKQFPNVPSPKGLNNLTYQINQVPLLKVSLQHAYSEKQFRVTDFILRTNP